MKNPTFTEFQNTVESTFDISQHDGFDGWDPCPALLYWDGRLNICILPDDEYKVDLFGGMFYGSRIDCEAELWHAAMCNEVFTDRFSKEFTKRTTK